MLLNKIKDSAISQGDLVLIIHNTKPLKSGFWRKLREGDAGNNTIFYVLEKPLHKNFDMKASELSSSRTEKGFFVMKDTTVKNDYDKKYNIIADVRGTDAMKLVMDDYDLNSIDLDSKNVKITDDFMKFMEIYNAANKKVSTLESVAMNCI